ncbi:MAG: aspartyl protease family protein [Novosphingobium sp.]|uniref:retroviral-like aspartic protease family protein n=1 Tax=Novosphingobium sp. TaxID=1874826 RepID=UPI001DBFE2BB|nr:retroviral-like aspartic protease family protein [Novosphingobium sp.]MCB2058811.1 aspartyl protease family protein [Novosphingobium sp.]MCP5385714.1 aspartyl protease family protein [Novosphingobium sp.]HNJ47720.1 retroviral-like aspartic protease family protein [Novosphingobium sp.]HNN55387.1 retroviral-like aspartic protease family protein [Novosphingobium sp.]
MPISPFLAPALALVAAMPMLAGQDGSQQASEVDVIAIGRDNHDHMTVPVKVAEQGPFRFMIDTGSQNTVLSTGVATQLALKPSSRAKLVGVAGSQIVDMVHVEQIDLGRRSYYGLQAPLLESGDMGADGILGLDSLQGQRVLVDFRKGLVAVDDARKLGGNSGYEIVVTARRKSGQLIMTDAVIDGIKVNVVIDTGSETSIGNRALQNALSHRSKAEQTTLHSVTGQQIVADIGFARKLNIDQITFTNVLIAYADAPPFELLGLDKRPALFLGMRDMRALDRIAIDFSSRKILFDLPHSAF